MGGLLGDSSTHLVGWEQVCKPKELGGLGIGNIRKRNEAMLAKWLWRFLQERDALRSKVIVGKYGIAPNNWDSGSATRVTFRCPWKSVQSVADNFFHRVKWKVGSGETIQFWEDAWSVEGPLCLRFPALYKISSAQNQPIANLVLEHDI